MIEHILAGELEKLGNYELCGQRVVKWLEHLETCDECRGKMRKPSVKQIIERLLTDEPENKVNKSEAVETKVENEFDNKSPQHKY